MMRKILTSLALLLTLSIPLVPVPALAYNPFGDVCSNDAAQGSSLCQGQGDSSQNPLTGTKGLIRGIANIIAFVAGLGAIITIIVGGLKYITAGGDANKAKSARDTIVAALVGLVIIALADTIIGLVLSRV